MTKRVKQTLSFWLSELRDHVYLTRLRWKAWKRRRRECKRLAAATRFLKAHGREFIEARGDGSFRLKTGG